MHPRCTKGPNPNLFFFLVSPCDGAMGSRKGRREGKGAGEIAGRAEVYLLRVGGGGLECFC